MHDRVTPSQRSKATRNLPQPPRSAPALPQLEHATAAERQCRSTLKTNPNHFAALYRLAVIRIGAGDVDDAIKLLRKAVNANPKAPEAHCLLGSAHRMRGRNEEAAARFEKAIALNPAYIDAHVALGNLCIASLRYHEAITAFETVLSLEPDHIHAHFNLGAVFALLERFREAVPHFERVLALQPDHRQAQLNLAKTLSALQQDAAALPYYDKFIAAEPATAETYACKSWSLRALGRFGEAREHVLRAIALAPDPAAFYVALGNLARFSDDDPHLARMEELLREPAALPPQVRWGLLFAVAKADADRGHLGRSFDHLLEANTLKRQRTAYDEAATLRRMVETRALFSADFMHRHRGQGDPSPAPIFVIGMPRSGTTLVEQILASHPNVFGAGELTEFQAAIERQTGSDDGAGPNLAQLQAWTGGEFRRLGAEYVAAIRPLAPAADRFTDKLPGNFLFAGLIHLALPNSRIVHMRRDPVDTCFSCFSILFGGNLPFAYDLGELGRYYRAYQALMEHWRAVLPAGVMIEIAYEDVVDDIEGQARQLLDHCGLPWHDACLKFHETRRVVHSSSAAQVRQPIFRSSVGRWLAYKDRLQPLLDALAPA